LMLWYSL